MLPFLPNKESFLNWCVNIYSWCLSHLCTKHVQIPTGPAMIRTVCPSFSRRCVWSWEELLTDGDRAVFG